MFDSVRARLTLWYSIALAVALVLLAILTNLLYWRNITQRTESNLVELADAFATTFTAEFSDQTGPDAPKGAARVAMIEHRFRDTMFALVDGGGSLLVSSLELPAVSPDKENLTPGIFSSREFRVVVASASSPRHFHRVPGGKDGFMAYSRNLAAGGNTYSLVLLQSLHPQRELMEDIRATFFWVIPVVLLLASSGGYFLARKSLAPVAAMATQARQMGAGNLHDRLQVANHRDELGQLAVSFNQLLERLEQSFERQRRFIADVSHELRTPVAILQGETEVTLSRAERAPEEYRETLAILRDESRRLAHIVDDLFTLTRADAGQYPLSLRELYLDELCADVLRHARSLVMAKNLTLTSNLEPDLPLHADEALLRRMILNLIDNAIKYAPENGRIHLECAKKDADYCVSLTNTGPAIPVELQERIFERFFRVDMARSREQGDTGGAGLGLSIARWIAEAHHGKLLLTRSDSSGTVFTAILPATAV